MKKDLDNNFDLIVIGAGSGGLAAAKRAASYGAKVAIIEGSKIGGTCVIRGCVPKKLMVYAASSKNNIKNSSGYGISFKNLAFNSEILLKNVKDEVSRLSEMHLNALSKLNVKVFNGWGSFIDQNHIKISCPNSGKIINKIRGERILISVGGKSKQLDILGTEFLWSSDDLFEINSFPDSVLIIGGGYIACEFACIFRNLGIDVTQVIRSNNLLNGFDKDLSDSLKDTIISSGIDLLFNEELASVSKKEDTLEISFKSGLKRVFSSALVAAGRIPNLDNLELDSVGLEMNGKYLKVNEYNQTNKKNIFAIGDIIDRPNLTPVAIEQGRVFSDNYYGDLSRLVNYKFVPKAVFTIPELASVGLNEDEAIKKYSKDNIRIFKCKFVPMSNTFKNKKNKSMLKLIVRKNDDKILGCHMFGDASSEIIQMASIALNIGVTKKDFDITMALHPTVSEEFVTMY